MNKAFVVVLCLCAALALARSVETEAESYPESVSQVGNELDFDEVEADVEKAAPPAPGDDGDSDSDNEDDLAEEPADESESDEDSEEPMEEVEEQEGESRRHTPQVNTILKVLKSIEAKIKAEISSSARHLQSVINSENRSVSKAQTNYNKKRAAANAAVAARNRAHGELLARQRGRETRIASSRTEHHKVLNKLEKELLLVKYITCKVLDLNGASGAAKCKKQHAQQTEAYHHRVAMRDSESVEVWSGYCSSHSRGNGWATYCTNKRDFTTANGYVQSRSNGIFTVQKTGVYRFRGRAIQYTANWGQHDMRLYANNKQVDYSHNNYNYHWNQNQVDMLVNLKQGQTLYFQAYTRGSNPYRWHSGNAGGAHSRVQVSYHGAKPYVSAYCTKSSSGSGWGTYCLNRVEKTNNAYFRVKGNSVYVTKPGYYRVNAKAIQYTSGFGWHLARVMVNGGTRDYAHDWRRHWARISNDIVLKLNKNDRISMSYYVSDNRYRYHSGSASGAHSRLQVSYEGSVRSPKYSGYCASHSRGNGWARYCLNRHEYNSMPTFISVASNGKITVKKNGMYRIHAWSIQHTNNFAQQDVKVAVNGGYKCYSHNHNYKWARHSCNFYWRLKKGDVVEAWYYVNGANPYRWHGGSQYARFQMEYASKY